MKKYDYGWALSEMQKLDPNHKFDTMIKTVAIITKLLETEQLRPIKEWGMQILALYYNQLDKAYMAKVGKGSETEEESN